MSRFTGLYVTAPKSSYETNFGRFYRHPRFLLEDLKRRSALAVKMGPEHSDPSNPMAPKPSVTNIISMKEKLGFDFKPAIPPYYAKLVAEYAVEHIKDVQRTIDTFGPEVAVGTLKAIPTQPQQNALNGDEIHAAIDAWVSSEGNPPREPELSTQTARWMYEQFLYFTSMWPGRFVRSEFTVWSYKYGYAGTGDLMAEDDEGLWLIDTKSGNKAYPDTVLQTAALSAADVILNPDGTESPMPKIGIQGVMHVRPRSVKLYRFDKTKEAFEVFLACKRIFDWNVYEKDLVMGDPFKTEWRKGDEA